MHESLEPGSEWADYMNSQMDAKFFCDWPDSHQFQCQDMELIASADEEKGEINDRCTKMYDFFQKSNLKKFLKMGPDYFRQWYAKVNNCTYAECLPYKFMHPLTDMLNHSNEANCALFVYSNLLSKRNSCDTYNKQRLAADMKTVLQAKDVPEFCGDRSEHPPEKLLAKWKDQLTRSQVWEIDYTCESYEDDDDEEEFESKKEKDFDFLSQCPAGETYVVLVNTSGCTIKAGEPLLVNYGRRSNSHLLLHYGFAVLNNPYDYQELTTGDQEYFYAKLDRLNTDLMAVLRGSPQMSSVELEKATVTKYKKLCQ